MGLLGERHDLVIAIATWVSWILAVAGAATPVYTTDDRDIYMTVDNYLSRRCVKNSANAPWSCNPTQFSCGDESGRYGAALAFVILAILVLVVPMFVTLVRLPPCNITANRAVDQLILYSNVVATVLLFVCWPITLSIYSSNVCDRPSPSSNDASSLGAAGILMCFAWILAGVTAKLEHSEQQERIYAEGVPFRDAVGDAWEEVRLQFTVRCPALARIVCCSCCGGSSGGGAHRYAEVGGETPGAVSSRVGTAADTEAPAGVNLQQGSSGYGAL